MRKAGGTLCSTADLQEGPRGVRGDHTDAFALHQQTYALPLSIYEVDLGIGTRRQWNGGGGGGWYRAGPVTARLLFRGAWTLETAFPKGSGPDPQNKRGGCIPHRQPTACVPGTSMPRWARGCGVRCPVPSEHAQSLVTMTEDDMRLVRGMQALKKTQGSWVKDKPDHSLQQSIKERYRPCHPANDRGLLKQALEKEVCCPGPGPVKAFPLAKALSSSLLSAVFLGQV